MHSNLRTTIYTMSFTINTFLYSIVWWYFTPPDPRTKYIGIIIFFTFIALLCLFLHISLGYAIVLLCICTNNTNVAQYQAIW